MLQFLGSQTLTSITLVSFIVELIWQTFVLYPFSGAELFIKKQRYSKSKTSLNGSFSTGHFFQFIALENVSKGHWYSNFWALDN